MVVSDTRVGRMDTTPLLKVLKQRHPEIVSAGTEERLVKAVQDEAMRLKPLAALAGQRHGARPPRRRPEEAVWYRVKRAPR